MAQFEKIPNLQEIFSKHKISDSAQKELKNAFEQLIVKAFYKELSAKPTNKPSEIVDVDRTGKCNGKCYIGTAKEKPCPNKATVGDYCKRHDPEKVSETKTKTKKTHDHNCNGIVKKTKKQCTSSGTVQPDGAEFHYCKRHSEKWDEYETPAKISDDEE